MKGSWHSTVSKAPCLLFPLHPGGRPCSSHPFGLLSQAPIPALSSKCASSQNPQSWPFFSLLHPGYQLLASTEVPFFFPPLPPSYPVTNPLFSWETFLTSRNPEEAWPTFPGLSSCLPEPSHISHGLLFGRPNIFNNIY